MSRTTRSDPTPDTSQSPAPSEHPARTRILIVEDDPDLWPLLTNFSRRVDPTMTVDFCESRGEAIEMLGQQVTYRAVVSDLCLPKPGDGLKLVAKVRELQPAARFGMISALMGFKPPKDVCYLAKPFTPDQYRHFLRDLIV